MRKTFFPQPAAKIGIVMIASLTLVACNNPDNDGVRNGPQAVHPSGSALSQHATGSVASY